VKRASDYANGDVIRPGTQGTKGEQRGTWYTAEITKVNVDTDGNPDGTYRVTYDDGGDDDIEERSRKEYLTHVPHLELFYTDDDEDRPSPLIPANIDLQAEWSRFRRSMFEECQRNTSLKEDPFKLLCHMLAKERRGSCDSERQGIQKLLEFVLIWSASSAESEREFSVQNLIKSWDRCNLSIENLDALMRIYRLERLRWYYYVDTCSKYDDTEKARMKKDVASHLCERLFTESLPEFGGQTLPQLCKVFLQQEAGRVSQMSNVKSLKAYARSMLDSNDERVISEHEIENIIDNNLFPIQDLKHLIQSRM
jgi:hypothetical protein